MKKEYKELLLTYKVRKMIVKIMQDILSLIKLINKGRLAKIGLSAFANSEGPDQPAYPCRPLLFAQRNSRY